MINCKIRIDDSKIPGAGKGLFSAESFPRRKILAFPNQTHTLFSEKELSNFCDNSIEKISSIRWFEDTYSSDIDWSEESHFNHSFNPNCLWHLGFVFAIRDIEVGEELTLNYQYLLNENTVLEYRDAQTGEEIRGITFEQKIIQSSSLLLNLFSN